MAAPTLLLASASPRRREILAAAGYRFRVVPAPGVEELMAGRASRLALKNAAAKGRAARDARSPGARELVLAADTVVVLGREVLGKPRDRADAARMLGALQGRWHRVVTGHWLGDGAGREAGAVVATRVRVLAMSRAEIGDYLATGEADDKAGAYGIQGRMAPYIDAVSGCYFNVVGLSPAAVRKLIQRLGAAPGDFRA